MVAVASTKGADFASSLAACLASGSRRANCCSFGFAGGIVTGVLLANWLAAAGLVVDGLIAGGLAACTPATCPNSDSATLPALAVAVAGTAALMFGSGYWDGSGWRLELAVVAGGAAALVPRNDCHNDRNPPAGGLFLRDLLAVDPFAGLTAFEAWPALLGAVAVKPAGTVVDVPFGATKPGC